MLKGSGLIRVFMILTQEFAAMLAGQTALGRDAYAEPESFTLLGGAEGVEFSVERTKGASEIGVADGVARRIGEIAAEKTGIPIAMADDGVRYTHGTGGRPYAEFACV